MKIRMGFVSNSSSSSFLIMYKGDKKALEAKLETALAVPEDHALYDRLADIPETFIDHIDYEFATQKELKDYLSDKGWSDYNNYKDDTLLKKLDDGFHVFIGSFDVGDCDRPDIIVDGNLDCEKDDLVISSSGEFG